jgi:hypothetical protein
VKKKSRLAFLGGSRSRSVASGILGGLLAASPLAAQYQFTGPSKCVQCHDHERQARKWQKEEPAAQKGKAHFATLKQLDNPKSAQWAKAIGLADAYDAKGACVKCHGTVFRGDANAGVSCESCHGPSSGYNDVHQEKGAYAKAVAAGLRDLKNKLPTIAKVCVECHVVPDKRLAAAGHPTGEAFDAGVSLQKLVHWDTAYNFGQVTAAGKAAAGGRAPTGVAKAPSAGGAAAPATGAPAGGGAAAPPASTAPVTAAKPASPAGAPSAASAAAPWNWDQPIRELPADYVPEPAPAEPAADKPATAPRAQAPRRPRAEPAVPPSLAEETPLPRNLTPAIAAEVPTAAPGPRTKAAEIAEARGKGAALLEKLLRAGARAKDAPAPSKPAEFTGPDSELLRLQDEALALAIEALRRPE